MRLRTVSSECCPRLGRISRFKGEAWPLENSAAHYDNRSYLSQISDLSWLQREWRRGRPAQAATVRAMFFLATITRKVTLPTRTFRGRESLLIRYAVSAEYPAPSVRGRAWRLASALRGGKEHALETPPSAPASPPRAGSASCSTAGERSCWVESIWFSDECPLPCRRPPCGG